MSVCDPFLICCLLSATASHDAWYTVEACERIQPSNIASLKGRSKSMQSRYLWYPPRFTHANQYAYKYAPKWD